MDTLNLDNIKEALSGNAAAFRSVTEYQPAGGPGDKIFPPTYAGGVYAFESRHIDGEIVTCVLLDSVQSQANRMELALLEESESGRVSLPVISIDFAGSNLHKTFRVTSLDAPHRIADALLRDSELDGVMFPQSDIGKRLDAMDIRNAAALFELCPTALVFGMWDSTGRRGGLGVKFQRALVSEIIGLHAQPGIRTGSRIDPAQILRNAATLYAVKDDNFGWTLDENEARKDGRGRPVPYSRRGSSGQAGRPSQANHGNVTPSFTKYGRGAEGPDPLKIPDVEVDYRIRGRNGDLDSSNRMRVSEALAREGQIAPGGVTVSRAVQTTVLSLPALRRLRFPISQGVSSAEVDLAARTALAALALFAAALVREQGADLRSRCLLYPSTPVVWELLDSPGKEALQFEIPVENAREIYQQAVQEAKGVGLPWLEEKVVMKPSPQLLELVRLSQVQASEGVSEELEVES